MFSYFCHASTRLKIPRFLFSQIAARSTDHPLRWATDPAKCRHPLQHRGRVVMGRTGRVLPGFGSIFQMIHSFHGSIGGTINFRKNYSNDDGFNECLWDGESSQHVKLHELNELWIALISWAMSWECFWRWLHLAKCCSERCLRSWMPWQRKHTIGNHVGKTVS